MRRMLPLLEETDFPAVKRAGLRTVQVNLGYRCNQSCLHCHVNAGPNRKEQMTRDTAETVLRFLTGSPADTLDITGGAPELNPWFRHLVEGARKAGRHVIDRCNLTILEEPDQTDLAAFLAGHRVEIIASLPCYLEENVDAQRGSGVFRASLKGLRRLNDLGYGKPGSGLALNLVYNPVGPTLPPAQCGLETDYARELDVRYGIVFNRLYSLANMPIARFGSTLVSKGGFRDYMNLLHQAHRKENLGDVMCRTLISIDYQGYVYDCDFNQMLGLNVNGAGRPVHLGDLDARSLEGRVVRVADHCYGCTAGQGSSCGGALN
ncbi:MAG: arsenosugar biosynthesis radical SAM (seleno)protein ArsS [Pseudomonadota bacterium]|nr:arsenosugar biosynthesis radical SAM (seleno)protein ArsS [Pseudomonadota bacterium]